MSDQANTQPANVTEPPEVIYTDQTRVPCDGGGGALGHPRVYLEMSASGRVVCPYCDRLYILSAGSQH